MRVLRAMPVRTRTHWLVRAAQAWAGVLQSVRAASEWARVPLPAMRAPIRELGAALPRHGSRQTQQQRSPSPPAPREMASAELAVRQQTRPDPVTTQTVAAPKWIQAKAMSPGPRSAANCHRSPGNGPPATGQAPTPAEVSCWKTCPNWAATPAVPNPSIGGDHRVAGLRHETQASPQVAGLRRETQASPRVAGLRRETQASPRVAGLCRETQASPRDVGPPRAPPAGRQPVGWRAV